MERCAGCGFEPSEHSVEDLPGAIRDLGRRYRPPLTRLLKGEDESLLRVRPAPETWSALEVAAHVPDALSFYRRRIDRVLSEDRPQLEALNPGSIDHGDAEVEPTLGSLATESDALATRLDGLDAAGWSRIGIGIDGDERTVLTLARRALHDGHHHLLDIGRALRAARGREG